MTAQISPERLAFLKELVDTWGGSLEDLIEQDTRPPGYNSCACGAASGCFRCRPEAWS